MPKESNHRKKEPVYIGKHLEMHPSVCRGELIFRNTRVPVRIVLAHIAQGMSVDEATQDWPGVSREAILEALSFAREALIRETETLRQYHRKQAA